jgi:hypothetical protein
MIQLLVPLLPEESMLVAMKSAGTANGLASVWLYVHVPDAVPVFDTSA